MFKKPIWRYIFIGFAWTVSLAGLIVLMSFIEIKKAAALCKDVKISIPGNQYFIDKDEVENILGLKDHALIGDKLESINIHALETRLKANPFIEVANVFEDMDGKISVEIRQRQPVMRIMNRFSQDFYVDVHGLKMPLSANFTARVLAANGYIDEPFANRLDTLTTPIARDLFATAGFLKKDDFWNAQIVEIYVNTNHEMELIPRVGNHRILLGNADSLNIKFRNLLAFYQQALPRVGHDTYKMLNIKYVNQVVAIKNDIKTDSVKAVAVAKPDTTKLNNNTTQIQH